MSDMKKSQILNFEIKLFTDSWTVNRNVRKVNMLKISSFTTAALEITRYLKAIRVQVDKKPCLIRTPKALHCFKTDRLTVLGKVSKGEIMSFL